MKKINNLLFSMQNSEGREFYLLSSLCVGVIVNHLNAGCNLEIEIYKNK